MLRNDVPTGFDMDRSMIEGICSCSFTEGNRIQLLHKGRETFNTIFGSIAEARHFICIQFYIFRNDETGKELGSLLKEKAGKGISVYLLYDHFGSFGTPKSFWDSLMEAGVQVKASRPFMWSSPLHYVHRDHRKLIIIDGIKAFTGGVNIANEYRGFRHTIPDSAWRDTGIMLEGSIVRMLLGIFKETWLLWKGKWRPADSAPASLDSPGFYNASLPAIPIFASSSKGRRRLRKLLYLSIRNSRRSIYLTTAYFTPSWRMIDSLADAVQRGVDVKILLPGKSDIPAAFYAGRFFFSRLLRAGVKIFTYQGEVLHAKTYVFDGIWSLVGSANLDFQSLRRNDEGNVGILDAEFGGRIVSLFNDDLTCSREVSLNEWRRRPFPDKMLEWFFALFRRRL